MPYIDSNFKINLFRGSHICQADCVAKDDLEFMILRPPFLSAGIELQACMITLPWFVSPWGLNPGLHFTLGKDTVS